MHGNVYEWCQDWYAKYPHEKATDPSGPSWGTNHVLRGGAWYSPAGYCRSAYRYRDRPDYRLVDFGFRLVCLPGQ